MTPTRPVLPTQTTPAPTAPNKGHVGTRNGAGALLHGVLLVAVIVTTALLIGYAPALLTAALWTALLIRKH